MTWITDLSHFIDAPTSEASQREHIPGAINLQTQVNLPEVRVASMSDQELETYLKLLEELRELLPAEEPKRIGRVNR